MQPLKGLTVVTLEHTIAAPFATRQLADRGARLIKIERPGSGDFARGYDTRLGLGYDELAKVKPGLTVCDLSGYGNDGPYRDKKAHDLLIQSESGFLSVTGTKDEPSKAGTSIGDVAAGMYAYSQILAALLQRGLTGKGQPRSGTTRN